MFPLNGWPIACFQLRWAERPRCTGINDRARLLLGLRPDDPQPEPLERLEQLLPAEEQANLKAQWTTALKTQQPLHWQGRCRAGAPAEWLRLEAQLHEGLWNCVLHGSSDSPGPVATLGNDPAQTALNLTEAIPVGTYTMVLRPGAELASFEFMSERFLELTGLKREEALADPLKGFACVHPEDFDEWVRLNVEAFSNRTPFFGQTRLVVNGEVHWITAESVPRTLPDGSIVWEGVLIDVTERVLAQQKLEKRRQELERILDNIPISIAFLDLKPADPEITFLNATFQNQLGYTTADIPTVSQWFPKAYPDPAYREEVLQRWGKALSAHSSGAGDISQNDDYVITTKSGRQLEMLINSVDLDDLVVFTFVDVSAFRQAQRQQLKDMDDKLRISLTASAVGHEIRQPLSSIIMNSRLALEVFDQDTTSQELTRERLEIITRDCQRLAGIAERVGLLLRNVRTEKKPLDLHEVIQSCLMQVQPQLRLLEPGFILDLPPGPIPLMGDALQLQLAICNLLRNGFDALKQHAIEHPQLLLQVNTRPENIELLVADNGPGFPDDLEALQPLMSLKEDGFGIGLFVVQLSVQNHGGTVSLGRSQRLGGAEVVLRLPQHTTTTAD